LMFFNLGSIRRSGCVDRIWRNRWNSKGLDWHVWCVSVSMCRRGI
jgi:hypothetical protein